MSLRTATWSGFHSKPIKERQDQLRLIFPQLFADDTHWPMQGLDIGIADHMVENCIGAFGIPLGMGVHFLINQIPYVIPMVIEEASVIAAASHGAKTISEFGGGFKASTNYQRNTIHCQVLLNDIPTDRVPDVETLIAENKDQLCHLAAKACPNLISHGGALLDIYCRHVNNAFHHEPFDNTTGDPIYQSPKSFFLVHVELDVKEIMGANSATVVAEHLAELIVDICYRAGIACRAGPCIASDLNPSRITTAEFFLPTNSLGYKGVPGDIVARRIVDTNAWAACDPIRAVTHNKGIMNGIDAVAIATGQDWRAIEAACHSFQNTTTLHKKSRVFTNYKIVKMRNEDADKDGDDMATEYLHGRIDLPLLVGVQSTLMKIHPTVKYALGFLGNPDANTLAQILASVGLAQNFSALRTLVTEGVSRGHMSLHARALAMSAGVPLHMITEAVQYMCKINVIASQSALDYLNNVSFQKPKDQAESVRSLPSEGNRLYGAYCPIQQPSVFSFKGEFQHEDDYSQRAESPIVSRVQTATSSSLAKQFPDKSCFAASPREVAVALNISMSHLGNGPKLFVLDEKFSHALLKLDAFEADAYTKISKNIHFSEITKPKLHKKYPCRANADQRIALKVLALIMKYLTRTSMSRHPSETRAFINYCCCLCNNYEGPMPTISQQREVIATANSNDGALFPRNYRRSSTFQVNRTSLQELLDIENEHAIADRKTDVNSISKGVEYLSNSEMPKLTETQSSHRRGSLCLGDVSACRTARVAERQSGGLQSLNSCTIKPSDGSLRMSEKNQDILQYIQKSFMGNDYLLNVFPMILAIWQAFEIRVDYGIPRTSLLAHKILHEHRAMMRGLTCFHPIYDSVYDFNGFTGFMLQHVKSMQFTLFHLIDAMALSDEYVDENVLQDLMRVGGCMEWEATVARDALPTVHQQDNAKRYPNAFEFWTRMQGLERASFRGSDSENSLQSKEFICEMKRIQGTWHAHDFIEQSSICDAESFSRSLALVKQYYSQP